MMNIDSFKLILKCPDSQALIFAREDFTLRWHQRLALRGHLVICDACTATEKNVTLLRTGLARWRAYGGEQ
jgi:hypothetical protein